MKMLLISKLGTKFSHSQTNDNFGITLDTLYISFLPCHCLPVFINFSVASMKAFEAYTVMPAVCQQSFHPIGNAARLSS